MKCAEIFETLQEINYILSTEDSILRYIKYGEKYNLFIFIFRYVFETLMSQFIGLNQKHDRYLFLTNNNLKRLHCVFQKLSLERKWDATHQTKSIRNLQLYLRHMCEQS